MLKALKMTLGVVTEAAEQANISRQSHYNWIEQDSEYADKVKDINEEAKDFVEGTLHKLIKGYELPDSKVFCNQDGHVTVVPLIKTIGPDTAATIFYAKTKMKDRGYIERQEITGADGPVVIKIESSI